MQSNKTRLIREIAHATELDFSDVENTLNEIISDKVSEQTKQLRTDIETLQQNTINLSQQIKTLSIPKGNIL